MTSTCKGDVWMVNLDPVVGSEIVKTRPAMIISSDIANQHSSTVTVLSITDRGHRIYPFEVEVSPKVGGLHKMSKIKADQIRIVDKIRLAHFIGVLPDNLIHSAERALCLHLEIDLSAHR